MNAEEFTRGQLYWWVSAYDAGVLRRRFDEGHIEDGNIVVPHKGEQIRYPLTHVHVHEIEACTQSICILRQRLQDAERAQEACIDRIMAAGGSIINGRVVQ